MPGKTGLLLSHTSFHKVRFSEVDSMGIMWHGHYLQYLEEAREAFGKQYGIGYLFVKENGFAIPITDLKIKYRASIKYGDEIQVVTKFIDTVAAKIIFEYEIKVLGTESVSAYAESTQVFTDSEGILQLNIPAFFLSWKHRSGLLS